MGTTTKLPGDPRASLLLTNVRRQSFAMWIIKTCPNKSLLTMMNSKQETLSFEDRTLRREHVILAFEAQDPPTVSTWVGGGTEQQGGERIPLHNIIASILQFLHPMCLLSSVIKFRAKK